jgi:hypothetical protein
MRGRKPEVTERQLVRIRHWWTNYVRRFAAGDVDLRRNMRLKEAHTHRVCREARAIGKALHLSPADLRLAEAVVLLHDVGRFVQYSRYRTFSDGKSENHALLGLKIIRREHVLKNLPERESSILRKAISYHNQAEIPRVKDRRVLLFARLLRDADKLDIWRLVIDYYNAPPGRKNHAISIGLPDAAGITPGVLEDLRAHRIVASENVRCLNDFKLLQLGWVFDLNFYPSFKAIRRRSYLERIAAVLPSDEDSREAFNIVRGYVDSRLAGEK